MIKSKIKKGDKVTVLSGKDKGKSGKVLGVSPKTNKVLIEGINVVTKHQKPKSRTQQGGIVKQESPINISNAMVVCRGCGQPTRVGKKILEDGSSVRVCKRCNEQLDA